MFKSMLVKYALPMVFELLIKTLSDLSKKSDNKIDDKMVAALIDNKDKILKEIKNKVN